MTTATHKNAKRIARINKSIALQLKVLASLGGEHSTDYHSAKESCERVLAILRAQLQVASA